MKKLILFSVILFLIFGCSDKFKPKNEIRTECKQGIEPVRKVLFIGWDGVRTDALLASKTACLDSMLNSSYYNLQTDRGTYTVSVPGWTSILHGVWPEKHGLTENSFENSNYSKYADIFSLARQIKPNLSLSTLSHWDDFLRITEHENFAQRYETDHLLKEAIKHNLSNCPPDVMLTHFDTPDAIGHDSGFSPSNSMYLKGIELMDIYLNEIMGIIEWREQTYNEEWMVLITTDHGGEGNGHGNQYDLIQTRFVWSIIRLPNLNQKIELSNIRSVDLMPTMLKWINIPVNPIWDLDGQVLF
ncbi:MAG: alkaline phosphatase family protein [Bacteroidetes bacterium]|nr:alkaline phosphatase family protein [Bacteroidota bacterium]